MCLGRPSNPPVVQAPIIPEKEDDPPILKKRATDGTETEVASAKDAKMDTGMSATGGTTSTSSLTIPKSKKKVA